MEKETNHFVNDAIKSILIGYSKLPLPQALLQNCSVYNVLLLPERGSNARAPCCRFGSVAAMKRHARVHRPPRHYQRTAQVLVYLSMSLHVTLSLGPPASINRVEIWDEAGTRTCSYRESILEDLPEIIVIVYFQYIFDWGMLSKNHCW